MARQHASRSPHNPHPRKTADRGTDSPHRKVSSSDGDRIAISDTLIDALQLERDNLAKAEALLACMVDSLERQPSSAHGPYYPTVAQLARELIAHSIDGLDPFVLERLVVNRVREEIGLRISSQIYADLHRLEDSLVLCTCPTRRPYTSTSLSYGA